MNRRLALTSWPQASRESTPSRRLGIAQLAFVAVIAVLAGAAIVVEPSLLLLALLFLTMALLAAACVRFAAAPFGIFALCAMFAAPRYAWPFDPMFVVTVAAVTVFVATYLHAGRPLLRTFPAAWVLLAIPFVSALFHWQGLTDLRHATYVWITLVSTSVVAVWLARERPSELKLLLKFALYFSLVSAVVAVYQRFTGASVIDPGLVGLSTPLNSQLPGRSAAGFGHPIVYGVFAQTMALLALLWRPPMWRIFFAANSLGIALSGSRTAWIGFALGLGLIAVLQLRGRLDGWQKTASASVSLILVAVLVGVLFPSVRADFEEGFDARVNSLAAQNAVNARSARTQMAWDMVVNSHGSSAPTDPLVAAFGNGPATSAGLFTNFSHAELVKGFAPTFDNTYASVLVDYGFFGLLCALTTVFLACRAVGWPGRVLVLALCADLWTFDFTRWPAVIVLIALSLGFGSLSPHTRATEQSETLATS